VTAQALVERDVTHHLGAGRAERTAERTGQRDGYRARPRDARVGAVGLRAPRVRAGSCFPARRAPRRRAERAPVAVSQAAHIQGVSTRRADELVEALGMAGISTRPVSRLCRGLDQGVERFRARALPGRSPARWLDATFVKARQHGRVGSLAVAAATGVTSRGERAARGPAVGPSEDGACRQAFLRGLVGRGLVQAVATVLQGARWQRRRVHWLRNALALAPKSAAEVPAASSRTVFAQPDAVGAPEQGRRVAAGRRGPFPKLADPLDAGEAEALADTAFPREHRRQTWSDTPPERLMKAIKRRTNVVGVFPNDAAIARLAGAVSVEQHEEWREGDQAALAPAAAD
jgi:transposase-like protein